VHLVDFTIEITLRCTALWTSDCRNPQSDLRFDTMTFSERSKSASLCTVPFGYRKWLGVSQSAAVKTTVERWVCALTAAIKHTPPVRTGTDRTECWVHYLLSASRVGIIIIIIIIIVIIIFTSSYHVLQTFNSKLRPFMSLHIDP